MKKEQFREIRRRASGQSGEEEENCRGFVLRTAARSLQQELRNLRAAKASIERTIGTRRREEAKGDNGKKVVKTKRSVRLKNPDIEDQTSKKKIGRERNK